MSLIEREEPLAVLARAFGAARTSGQLVSVCGEAGIGKSSLLHAFAARDAAAARVCWGYCEALGTPRPLGPLLDIAPTLDGRTADALATGASRHDIFAAVVSDLGRPTPPVVVIVEDAHWADEATLDLLQYVGRRIVHTRALVIVSWRDDEVSPDHAIHRVLGEWPHPAVQRIRLQPLSLDAVDRLAAGTRDPRALLELTSGNPFFVTEVLGSVPGTVPASVREAVLARRARLDMRARAVLDLVSVVPTRTELALIDAALAPETSDLAACITAGLLRGEGQTVAFRHELARLAVLGALPSPRVHDCHRRVLRALVARSDRAQLLARIVHHAEACGDVDVLLEHAPAAARQAAAVGAHRQAVDHYRRALAYGDALPRDARATLAEALAYEHYLTGDVQTARDVEREALALWRAEGVPLAVGRCVRWLSRLAWFAGDGEEAHRRADEAIAVLRDLPECEEVAMAYSNRSQLDMLGNAYAPCLAWGTKAIDLARALGAREILSHALNNVGTVRLQAGEPEGRAALEESLRLALDGDLHEHAARAYTNLASTAVERREYDEARRWLDVGILYCTERDLDSWQLYMLAWRARLRAETGLWPGACSDADVVVTAPRVAAVSRIPALAALGLVYARRGDPRATPVLDEALVLAAQTAEPQRLVPVRLARAECAWFAGDRAGVEAEARAGLAAMGPETRSFDRHDRLWYWLWKVGAWHADTCDGTATGREIGPYARLVAGDWRHAAEYWQHVGCPYERAQALVEGDVDAVQTALGIFQNLGATPAADWARQRLRQLGLTRVPRGQRSSTRAHPAGLTTREAEILPLLAQGLRNPQIAKRLFVSPKTIEHHVSSILAKLQVATRDAAVVHARARGWLDEK